MEDIPQKRPIYLGVELLEKLLPLYKQKVEREFSNNPLLHLTKGKEINSDLCSIVLCNPLLESIGYRFASLNDLKKMNENNELDTQIPINLGIVMGKFSSEKKGLLLEVNKSYLKKHPQENSRFDITLHPQYSYLADLRNSFERGLNGISQQLPMFINYSDLVLNQDQSSRFGFKLDLNSHNSKIIPIKKSDSYESIYESANKNLISQLIFSQNHLNLQSEFGSFVNPGRYVLVPKKKF